MVDVCPLHFYLYLQKIGCREKKHYYNMATFSDIKDSVTMYTYMIKQ